MQALVDRSVTAGETVRIPYPADQDDQEDLLDVLKSDSEDVAAVDFEELEATLNAMIYDLFGIDETGQETIELFLEEYSER